MDLLPYVQRKAFQKFRGGNPGPWGAIAAVAIGLRTMQRIGARRQEVVYRKVLEPGETLQVGHLTLTERQVDRRDRRAGKGDRRARAVGRSRWERKPS